jgi:hypothetical protein
MIPPLARSIHRLPMRCPVLVACFLAPSLWGQTAPTPPTTATAGRDNEGEIVFLSPFVVSADDDRGYQATSTLAGTRLRTNLRDLGSAISVVTPEFLSDVGAVDQGTLLSYTTSTETGGVQGNFSGVGDNQGRPGPGFSRTDPQANQRIRGLDRATVTRDFFITDVGFDEYNSSRITINRGPNALLFGLGSPGGIINHSLKQPLYRDEAEVRFRFGARSTTRTTFDVNKVIVPDRFAIRMAGLYGETYFRQRPAFNRDRRIYTAFDAKLFEGKRDGLLGPTVLRGNLEFANFGGTPPSTIPPGDAFTSWWRGLSRDVQKFTGTVLPPAIVEGENYVSKAINNNRAANAVNNTFFHTPFFIAIGLIYQDPSATTPSYGFTAPNLAGLQGGMARIPARPGRQLMDQRWSGNRYTHAQMPGFSGATIQDRAIFDYRNKLISGNLDDVWNDFEAYNVTLDQALLGGNAGVELAYDKQIRKLTADMGFGSGAGNSGDNYDIYIDISQFASNDEPNPNVGRAVMKNQPAGLVNRRFTEREAVRATAFYQLDFGKSFENGLLRWLGRHIFTGLFTDQSLETETFQNALVWDSRTLNAQRIFDADVNVARRNVVTAVYLTEPLFNLTAPEQLRIPDYIRIPKIQAGDEFTVFYFDPVSRTIKNGEFYARDVIRSGNLTRNEVKSQAFSVQSYLLDDHLVGLVGWRTDDVKAFERAGSQRLPDGEWDVTANHRLQSTPSFEGSGNTFTWSVVAHYPSERLWRLPLGARFSLHYNESDNFDSQSQRRDLYGRPIAPPTGTTKEYGFSIESAQQRVGARFNWFETAGTLKTVGAASSPMNQIFFWSTEWLVRARDAELLGIPVQEIPGMDPRYTSYSQFYAAIEEIIPPQVRSQYNIRFEGGTWRGENIQGVSETSDTLAKGFEIELVGSPVRNWNLSFNVAKQETITTNSAPLLAQVASEIRANIERLGLAATFDSHSRGESNTFLNRMRAQVFSPVAGIRARDGTVSQEQRKWRVNTATSYRHSTGVLKGFGYGAAVRWQDKVATGYPLRIDEFGNQVPVLDQAYFGPSEWATDLWFNYERRTKLFWKVDWRIQLNVRNAFGTRGDIPTLTNPDGQVAVIRIENPTEWFVTNSFRF